MTRRPQLSINVAQINLDSSNQSWSLLPHEETETAFRQEGVSVGNDYLRLDGHTITRGELFPHSLEYGPVIGCGAFSRVHRAVWKRRCEIRNSSCGGGGGGGASTTCAEQEIPVAVKEFRLVGEHDPSSSSSTAHPQRRKMLIQEIKALSRTATKISLVSFYGAFLWEDKTVLVLELMDRGCLDSYLRNQRWRKHGLPEVIIAPIAYQILHGLTELHQDQLVHRDLKPANVLLHSNGAVKLCDFGLTTLSEQSLHTTVLGTTQYMAPERLRAQPYGRQSDLWSLGLILMACILGKSPFLQIHSIVDLLVTIEETNYSELLPPQLEQGLCEIVLASLQLKQEKRIPSQILLQSPWFRQHNIQDVETARCALLKAENSSSAATS